MSRYVSVIVLATATVFMVFPVHAQLEGIAENLTMPTVSPGATISQEIGISTVTITYHRPSAKGRTVFGGLEKYGRVWRAGANENTTITFSHDANVNGRDIAKGTYGLHMIPSEDEWTLILSKNNTSWGSFFYNQGEDALRVAVEVEEGPHSEWLRYGFDDITPNSAQAYLSWDKTRVPFTVEFDVHAIVLDSVRNELRTVPAFSWQGWFQAAGYCVSNDINHEEALAWINRSIQMEKNHSNLRIKGQLLMQMGEKEKARAALEESLELAPAQTKPRVEELLESL